MNEKLIESIAFDIDDTVLESAQAVLGRYNEIYGTNLHYENWYNYKFDVSFGYDPERALTIFREMVIKDEIPLIEGAREVLRDLYRALGSPLTFITSREKFYADIGARSLSDKLGVPLCVQSSNDKGDPHATKIHCLVDMGINTFVDDLSLEVENYMKAGVTVILIAKPWNKSDRERLAGKYNGQFLVCHNWEDMGQVLLDIPDLMSMER